MPPAPTSRPAPAPPSEVSLPLPATPTQINAALATSPPPSTVLLTPTTPTTFEAASATVAAVYSAAHARDVAVTVRFAPAPAPAPHTSSTSPADTHNSTSSAATHTPHAVVAVGGTFDHLHAGHRLLLTMTAFTLAPHGRMVVGVSGPALLGSKQFAAQMESWPTRVASVIGFLRGVYGVPEEGVEELERGEECVVVRIGGVTVQCVMLHEPCGPTITDEGITLLVVTEETRRGGEVVNEERRKRGLRELEVLCVGLVAEEGEGGKLSSTELRRREAEGT
ncbi:hypothetical protein EDC01DRAFT_726874 [Geopyxis carbonaria]|nr:hypothetical protein EDC01DRAFT_726874 [Geopyxis carbonaria]